jgi:hypothetical protein
LEPNGLQLAIRPALLSAQTSYPEFGIKPGVAAQSGRECCDVVDWIHQFRIAIAKEERGVPAPTICTFVSEVV